MPVERDVTLLLCSQCSGIVAMHECLSVSSCAGLFVDALGVIPVPLAVVVVNRFFKHSYFTDFTLPVAL